MGEQPDSFVASLDGTARTATARGHRTFTRWLEQPQLALVPPGESATEAVVLARVLLSGGTSPGVDPSPRSVWRRTDLKRKGNR